MFVTYTFRLKYILYLFSLKFNYKFVTYVSQYVKSNSYNIDSYNIVQLVSLTVQLIKLAFNTMQSV